MGFLSGVGKVGKGIGKVGMLGARGIGATTIGASKALGHFPAKGIMANPGLFAGAVGVGVASGALIADAAGEDPKKGAKAMGIAALGATTLGAVASSATLGKVGAGVGSSLVTTMGSAATGAVVGTAGVISELGAKMIKMPMKDGKPVKVGLGNLSDISLSGFGKVALGVGLVASGAGKAYKTFEKSRMGVNDGMLRSATPIVPQVQQQSNYLDNAGATGDLVFSMYNNR